MRKILLFYKYVEIEDPIKIKEWQFELCKKLNLKGRIIIASEGINGTVGGLAQSTNDYIRAMQESPIFSDIDFKESDGIEDDFPRMQVIVKKEIVKLGIDPKEVRASMGAVHLTPQETHEMLLNKPSDLVILDGRNGYESKIGAFQEAIKPQINYFREFPKYIEENISLFKDKKVLMYCTGGIRCERASACLKLAGVEQVYQIKGGIHRYIEKYPNGFFRGKNYVFDGRISAKVNDDILSNCDICNIPCDDYTSCINAKCNKQITICAPCREKLTNTCSKSCFELVSQNKTPLRPFVKISSQETTSSK